MSESKRSGSYQQVSGGLAESRTVDFVQIILLAAFLLCCASALVLWVVAAVANVRALFHRKPGVDIFGNSIFGFNFALLMRPERFTESGQRIRRTHIRGMQGFLASLLAGALPAIIGAKGFSSAAPYVFWLVMAFVCFLILGALESLLRP